VGPQFVSPRAQVTQNATQETADDAQAAIAPLRNWWQLYNSPLIDQWVATANQNSPTVQAATAALEQTTKQWKAGFGAFLPQVGLSTDAQRTRVPALPALGKPQSSVYNVFAASGVVSFDLDVWGKHRREWEALAAQVDVATAQQHAARLALTANTVTAVVSAASLQAQIRSHEAMEASVSRQVALIRATVQSGVQSETALWAAEQKLHSVQSETAVLQNRFRASMAVLKTLTASEAGILAVPDIESLSEPSVRMGVVKSVLIENRPDVRAAEGLLHVASAHVGVATAALLPDLSVQGSLGRQSDDYQQIKEQASRAWAGSAGINVPIFAGGQLWYQRQAARSGYQVALANYQQTVLEALEQVQDALDALARDEATVAHTRAIWVASQRVDHAAEAQLKAGFLSEADYHTTHVATLVAHEAWVNAQSSLLADTAAFYTALGAGQPLLGRAR